MMREAWARGADGTPLFAADHGPLDDPLPLICLPGLTRNGKDFEPLIGELGGTRRLVALDLRGRGRSGRADAQSYVPGVEAADTLAVMDALGIARAIFIGTSRGGIVSLRLHAMAPARVAAILFNDIGPRLEPEGLLRIGGYLGQVPALADFHAAAAALKSGHPGFDGVTDAEWLAFARRVFRQDADGVRADYDPALARNFPAPEVIRAGEVPELWDLYAGLGPLPLAVLRGTGSDLLSAATVARMAAVTPQIIAADVPGRGHVPFLDEPESLSAIRRLLAATA